MDGLFLCVSTEIKLIPKTPSAKARRGGRKRLASVQEEDDEVACSRPLRNKANAENRRSKDSGVDFEIPRPTRYWFVMFSTAETFDYLNLFFSSVRDNS